jgi:hypothetical protein
MKWITRGVALVLVAAIGVWVWRTFFPSPEIVIKKRLIKLARDASFSPNDSQLSKIAGARAVPDFFAPEVDIVLDLPRHVQHVFNSREEIAEKALGSRQAAGLSVSFPDINVSVNPDRTTAVADVTLNATIRGEQDDIVEELHITFQNTNGDWLIRRVQTVEPVSLH